MARVEKPLINDVTKPEQFDNEQNTKPAVQISTQGPAQMSLPVLLAHIMQHAMEDKRQMPALKRDLALWYHAQDPALKQVTARETKKELEIARTVVESVFQEFMYLAHADF
jgi:hypothetical protein